MARAGRATRRSGCEAHDRTGRLASAACSTSWRKPRPLPELPATKDKGRVPTPVWIMPAVRRLRMASTASLSAGWTNSTRNEGLRVMSHEQTQDRAQVSAESRKQSFRHDPDALANSISTTTAPTATSKINYPPWFASLSAPPSACRCDSRSRLCKKRPNPE